MRYKVGQALISEAATMSGPVREILERIRSLSDDDRRAFEREWEATVEREWKVMSAAARSSSAASGLDDAAIARAVEADRYGK
jgi:hypothetical protein